MRSSHQNYTILFSRLLLLVNIHCSAYCPSNPVPFSCFKNLIVSNQGPNVIARDSNMILGPTNKDRESRTKQSTLYASKDDNGSQNLLVNIDKYKLSHKIIHIVKENSTNSEEPIIVEIFASGDVKIGILTGFVSSPQGRLSASEPSPPPRLEVSMLHPDDFNIVEKIFVDLGQITTIWEQNQQRQGQTLILSPIPESTLLRHLQNLSNSLKKAIVPPTEKVMQDLYNTHVGRGRRASLTKKQLNAIPNPSLQTMLRLANKAGGGMARMISSLDVMDVLFVGSSSSTKTEERLISAMALSIDAKLGGRFKRQSSIFVSKSFDESENDAGSLMLLNGGWIAVDSSVRAGAEARKFVERSSSVNSSVDKEGDVGVQLLTAADERIAYRLECLAMGEEFSISPSDGEENEVPSNHPQLELDVRETLSSLDFPVSPEGAKMALVRVGRWSESQSGQAIEPWSKSVITAAKELATLEHSRRKQLFRHSLAGKRILKEKVDRSIPESETLENRVDLSTLPCVCIDAKGATFLDDSIGVRPRSMTGRKLIPEASKWEILIHIADVSDIYCSKPYPPVNKDIMRVMENSSASRGYTRYDLPFGPLHLLPPVALEALSLETKKIETTDASNGSVNRCVTLWAYIDERSGKLIDAGLERTIISTPTPLTFQMATNLLESDTTQSNTQHKSYEKAKAVLAVAQRNLSLWTENYHQSNDIAKKRQSRLLVREMVSKEVQNSASNGSKKSRKAGMPNSFSFQRQTGHRLVDASMELYAFGLEILLRKKKAIIPRASGAGSRQGGRLGTGPLRRYIDGMVQRQALSVLCEYGGNPMTREDCTNVNKIVAKADNALSNFRSTRSKNGVGGEHTNAWQRDALKSLQQHMVGFSERKIKAVATGRENEIVLVGIGAVAKCKGVKGTLKSGENVLVEIVKLQPEKGILTVKLVKD